MMRFCKKKFQIWEFGEKSPKDPKKDLLTDNGKDR